MTFKEITDALYAGKRVGHPNHGWLYVDSEGMLAAEFVNRDFYCEDHLVGFLFCSCDELEVR